ncbi:GNAT family N-acetyltransferase [Adhaeribacter rhizoryzae]|uniref:GNAT family N-acetyltransferase n=1 Tax=Adhaeribacter rhizoryzae TaxID=2607907 RepID=A0A5M6CYM5_9BACT|nr:GNAT family N-acetyltransferase [Adhaeribacter rhizoryzae]KAA5540337.1 GNAT family N-acetyltransferase [Adhaeribacter rhizoryzae]
MSAEYTKGDFIISIDSAKLQLAVIYEYLAKESYWAENIPLEVVTRAIANSLNFGLYTASGEQIGFARIITDYATFAYLADVFVLPEYLGQGLSKWLMECIMAYPDLQNLRRFMLMTRDAHTLYTRFGFTPLKDAANCLEIARPGLYKPETDTVELVRDPA